MRSQAQALQLAKQIRAKAGARLARSCADTIIPVAFLAGLISVENARLIEQGRGSTRFEAHVFTALKALRDGARRSYNSITRLDVRDATDAALRALATSYGLTQIMGWSMVKMLKGGIADLRDPAKHLDLAVKRLIICGGRHLAQKDYASVLRIWNTGSPRGSTHDPDYVQNALAVMRAYERFESQQVSRSAGQQVEKSKVKTTTEDLRPVDLRPVTDVDLRPVISDDLIAQTAMVAVKKTNKAKAFMVLKTLLVSGFGLSLPAKVFIALLIVGLLFLAYRHRARLFSALKRTTLTALNLNGD